MNIIKIKNFTSSDELLKNFEFFSKLEDLKKFPYDLIKFLDSTFDDNQYDTFKKIKEEDEDEKKFATAFKQNTYSNKNTETEAKDNEINPINSYEYNPEEFLDNDADWYCEVIEHPKTYVNNFIKDDDFLDIPNKYYLLPEENYKNGIFGFSITFWDNDYVMLPNVLLTSGEYVPHPNYLYEWNYYAFECDKYKEFNGFYQCIFHNDTIIVFNKSEYKDLAFIEKTLSNIDLYYSLEENLISKVKTKKHKI